MSDTTVWALATATGQPLEVVVFQAVAYKAWNPGGTIDSEWAAVLTGVLGGAQPWRRTTTLAATTSEAPHTADSIDQQPVPEDTATDPTAVASAIVAQLGQHTVVTDLALAERFAAAGLGEVDTMGFLGYPEEAPTWSQLANGSIGIEDLEET